MYRPEDFAADPALRNELVEAVESSHPRTIRSAKIKLTARCNLRCYMCSYWKGRERDELDTSTALALVKDLSSSGCLKVHFSGGEVLLRPDAFEIFAAASTLGIRVNITTNATLLDKDRATALVDSGVRSVTISIDSPIARVHDRIRGYKGSWKKTMRGLERLHRIRRKRGSRLKIRINTVITRHNWESLCGLPDLLAPFEPDQVLLIPVDEKNDLRIGLNRGMIKDFNSRVATELAARGLETGIFDSSTEAFPFGTSREATTASARGEYAGGYYDCGRLCWVPWLHVFVSANGDVYPCCMSRGRIEPLGNVTAEPIHDVFRGASYRRLRRRMRTRMMPVCRRCDNFARENRIISSVPELAAVERFYRSGGESSASEAEEA